LRILTIVVDHIADDLAKVNNSNPIDCEFKFNKREHSSLRDFNIFYRHFQQVLTKEKEDTPQIPTTFPPSSPHSTPSESSKSSKRTSSITSKPTSTSSGVSKAEHYTQDSATLFLSSTFETIEEEIEKFAWWSDGKYREKYGIRFSVFAPPSLLGGMAND
jgi:ribosomal protein S25